MLTAQPSTYDMFGLIELYGRKLQSVYKRMNESKENKHVLGITTISSSVLKYYQGGKTK